MLADKGICVSRVSNNNCFLITGTVVVDSFTNINKDLTVILEQITTFHSRSTGLGSNKEVVADISECSCEVTSDNDFIEEREGTVM